MSEGRRLCECQCGESFVPTGPKHIYLSHTHATRAKYRLRHPPFQPVDRECALPGCGGRFLAKKPSWKFCSHECGKRAWGRLSRTKRAERRGTKAERHPNTALIHEARRDTAPGECLYCPERVSRPQAYICGSAECLTEYRSAYGTIRRKREKEARGPKPPLPERECRCECGQRFVPRVHSQVYVDDDHWRARRNRERRALATAKKASRLPGQQVKREVVLFGRAAGPKVLRPFA